MSVLPPLELDPLPEIDLRHLMVLTDDTAMLQHATFATPNLHHGYCTDDNARALMAGVLFCDLQKEVRAGSGGLLSELLVAMQRYLAFLAYAFTPTTGRFRNLMSYDRAWAEKVGSEDSHARSLWGLGVAVRRGHTADVVGLADKVFREAMPAAESFEHIRPWAYTILGIDEYLHGDGDFPQARQLRDSLCRRLYEVWRDNADDDWPWWEDELTWGSAKLPQAMLVGGAMLEREDMIQAALKALRWCLEVQTGDDGRLSIIGNRGWFVRGGEPAKFEQQPIEAKALVQACIAAAWHTRDKFWADAAVRCFRWFTGFNDVGAAMYNPNTGGCYDGLTPNGPNSNQGAESTLAYVISVLELHHYRRAQIASRDLEK